MPDAFLGAASSTIDTFSPASLPPALGSSANSSQLQIAAARRLATATEIRFERLKTDGTLNVLTLEFDFRILQLLIFDGEGLHMWRARRVLRVEAQHVDAQRALRACARGAAGVGRQRAPAAAAGGIAAALGARGQAGTVDGEFGNRVVHDWGQVLSLKGAAAAGVLIAAIVVSGQLGSARAGSGLLRGASANGSSTRSLRPRSRSGSCCSKGRCA